MKHSHHCNKCMREYPCFISHTGQLLGYLVTAQCLECHRKAMEKTLAALEASTQRLRRFMSPPRDLLTLKDFKRLYEQGFGGMFDYKRDAFPEEYDPNARAEERHHEPK